MVKMPPKLIERLGTAYQVVVLTGAGMSAASGIPTFRGKDGLWNKYDPRELANKEAFLRNPGLVWEWYTWRRSLVKNAQPNLGHYALVDLETYLPEMYVITQNVDSLHQKAGTQKIIELHGNILRSKCIDCNVMIDEQELANLSKAENGVPLCPNCGALIRPDVVWFGENLPAESISKAQDLAAGAEVFFSIGTSSTVEPAASLPYIAKGNGAYVVEINPEETPLSAVADERFNKGADKVLPYLVMEIDKIRPHQ